MARLTRNESKLVCICFLLMLLGIFAQNILAQDFPSADHSLTLTGPDVEDMLTCSLPRPISLDATVEWYVNGQILKTELLPHNNQRLYESIQDLADLLGDYPQTVQCVINQGTINYVPVISNKLILSPQ